MSLAVQRERIVEHAAGEGLELLGAVQESASGGVRDGELFSWEHRPVLLELVARAREGAYDVQGRRRYSTSPDSARRT